jgi:transmembrane sensor
MDVQKKLDHLLADEKFQNDILNHKGSREKEHDELLRKYSISENEFAEAEKMISGMLFIQKKSDPKAIRYAQNKLQEKISTTKNERKTRVITLVSKIAAVLSIPLLLSTLYFYQQSENSVRLLSSQENVLHTYQAKAGVQTRVTLPDGSLVWLNSGSSVSCPAAFSPNIRQVELKGEAYFEVVKSNAPMIVSAGHVQVRVYGTKFNLKAYADESVVATTLVEGKVSVITEGSRNEYLLDPGYTAFYSVTDEELKIAKIDEIDAFTGWKDGKLLFNNEPFAVILKKMERWYNVDIQLKDTSLGHYVLYATFIDENIEQMFDILSKSIPIAVSYPKRVRQADGSYTKREILIERAR